MLDRRLTDMLEELGLAATGDPAATWRRLYDHFGPSVTIIDRYALEAAFRGVEVDALGAEDRARIGEEVLEAQFPGIELVGEPSGQPIEVVDYDADWPLLFERWRARLNEALPTAQRIEHVGSTAVPGLAAKPIIDIQVSVPDLDDEASYRPGIEATGVVLRSRDRLHRYFRPVAGSPRTVHIHVCPSGGTWERDHILLRDFLRAHPDAAASYGRLKTELAGRYRNDRLAYTDAKAEFIFGAMERAREWASASGV